MSQTNSNPPNLKQRLDTCLETLSELEASLINSSDSEYQSKVLKSLDDLSQLHRAINILGLFSDNESINEVNTPYIKFLLVDYLLGIFSLKVASREKRLALLNEAKLHFNAFIMLSDNYGLASEQVKSMLNNPNPKSVFLSREDRIVKFRKDKELKAKVEDLKQLAEPTDDNDELDEDIQRELYLALVEYYLNDTIDELVSIGQEIELLKSMPPMFESNPESDADIDSLTWRLDRLDTSPQGASGLLDPKGKPLRPFVITGKRDELKDQVFRQSWRLPTMTVDEYLQMEMDRGNVLQGGGERPEKQELDDNDFVAQDEETLKQREWDEFKDFNPRGSGNRGNKG